MLTNLNRPTALIIGAVAMIIGVVSPWITVFGVITAGPTNFAQVGLVLFGGIALVIVSALTGRYMRAASIIAGVIVLSEVVYVWFGLSENSKEGVGELVSPGWGLYFSTLAGLFLVASTWIAKQQD